MSAMKEAEMKPIRPSVGRRRFLGSSVLAGVAAVLLPAAAARAAPPQPVALSAADQADLQRIAAYLSGITTMIARFRQVAANGAVSLGTMWVARPGRMRFEYDPPNPITLIADSYYVYYYDKQLDEVHKVGLKSTPAWFLLRSPVTFGPDIIVTGFQHTAQTIGVRVVERAHPDGGSLTMVFSDNPMALRQWTVVDAEGKATTVTLSDLRYGMALDPTLFQYQDPYAAARRKFEQQ
jgi:outer membrane lipoprotein-sorting protein